MKATTQTKPTGISELRSLRSGKGYTLTALALTAGIEPSMLSLIERGKRPAQRTADKLASVLNVTPVSIWPEYQTFRGGGRS